VTRRSFLVVLLTPFLLVACATGPTLTEISRKIPPISANESRVWFYRDASPVGSALQPTIYLNGKPIGQSVPGGFFFVDTAPGSCVVSTSTEVERHLTFVASAGGQSYVKTSIAFGVLVGHVYPELVDPKVGQRAIGSLHFTGKL
jgi:Protein of unknown function (DUF2846)